MKLTCLSGVQPFWIAIIKGWKPIENRYETSSAHQAMKRYRGWLYLHASAGVGSLDDFDSACDFIRGLIPPDAWEAFRSEYLTVKVHRHEQYLAPRANLPRGVFVGRCKVTGLIEPGGRPFGDEGKRAVDRLVAKHGEQILGWHIQDQWGHILEDVEPTKTLRPAKGALGLWTYDTEAAANAGGGP